MKIIKIKKTKLKVLVTLDEGKLELFPSTYASHSLYINKIIDENEISEIKEENKIEEYFLFSVKRLMLNDYSPKKVEELLQKKGANKIQVKKVIEKLQKYNFINEEKLVEQIISYCDSKHYGFFRITKMLNDRKISSSEIKKVKYNLKREENEAKIQAQVLLRKYKNKSASETKKAVYQGLIRNGFDEELSREISGSLITYNHIHEINVLKLDYQKYFLKYSIKYQGYELESRITEALLCKGYRNEDIKEISNEMD